MSGGTRRDFLRVVAASGGALVLGLVVPACRGGVDPATAERAARTGEFVPNAFLKILPDDRIVVVLHHVEMGQGTMTSHATLIAEELEVDPRNIQVELAPADRRYDNPDLQMGFQITGGSSSVRFAWEPLRRAGATAREMLRAAAAAMWGVPIDECVAEDGAIRHPRSGKRETYGKLTRAAAHQPVPEPRLKDPSAFKWIGKATGRLDARMKVDGSGVFGIDVRVPGMLSACVLRPPTLKGGVKSFDADEARREPGVVDVFQIPTGVAVVATSYWRARAAAARVRVTWDEGPLRSLSTRGLRDEYRKRAEREAKAVRDDGDVDEALKRGAKVVEAVYEVPYLAHATMEPQNCTASVRDGRCEIWAPTQAPGLVISELKRSFGFADEDITVHTTLLGGGFGRRLQQDFVIEAVHVARRVGKPVKVIWSREDDMRNDVYRPATYNVLKGAVDGRGDIVAWFHRIVGQSILAQVGPSMVQAVMPSAMPRALASLLGRSATSMYGAGLVADQTQVEGAADFAYALPSLRVENATVEPGVPIGFWRSVGSSENVFVVESFLDELAHAAGRDPYQVRRALLRSAPRHLGVLDLAAQKAGWGSPAPPGIFRGIAQAKCFGSHCAEVVEVSVEGQAVHVRRVVAAVDCGLVVNPDIVRAQVESAIVFGLSAALKQAITLKDGRVEQGNFHDFELLRMHEMPSIEVHIVPSDEPPSGIGEPGVPPVAPALCNAIFAATGRRIRALPIEPGSRIGALGRLSAPSAPSPALGKEA